MFPFKELIDLRIMHNTRTQLKRIDVDCGNGLFNLRCHENAVQYASTNPGTEVVAVVCIGSGFFLHYINRRKNEDGSYIYTDNTLGYFARAYDYYELEVVHEDSWLYITDHFMNLRKSFLNKHLNWLQRVVFYPNWSV